MDAWSPKGTAHALDRGWLRPVFHGVFCVGMGI
jgi:hypothetical protein